MEITEKQKEELYRIIKTELDRERGVIGEDVDDQDFFNVLMLTTSLVAQPLIHEYFRPENFEVPNEKQESYKNYKDQQQIKQEQKTKTSQSSTTKKQERMRHAQKTEERTKPTVVTEKTKTAKGTTTTTTITVNGTDYDLSNLKTQLSPQQLAEIRKTFSSDEAFQGYLDFLQNPNVSGFFSMVAKNNKKK